MGLIRGKKRNDAAAEEVVQIIIAATECKGAAFEWFVALLATASPK